MSTHLTTPAQLNTLEVGAVLRDLHGTTCYDTAIASARLGPLTLIAWPDPAR